MTRADQCGDDGSASLAKVRSDPFRRGGPGGFAKFPFAHATASAILGAE